MLRRLAIFGLLALGIAFPARPSLAASFDCTKAASATEKLICGDAALGKPDDALAETYTAALQPVSEEGRKAMRDGQRQWLRFATRVCGLAPPRKNRFQPKTTPAQSAACLSQKYEDRERQLKDSVVARDGIVIRPAESFVVTDAPYVPEDDLEERPDYERYPYSTTKISYPVIDGPNADANKAFNDRVQAILKGSPNFAEFDQTDTNVEYTVYQLSGRLISLDMGWWQYGQGSPHGVFGNVSLNWLLEAKRALAPEDLFDKAKPWQSVLDTAATEALRSEAQESGFPNGYSGATAEAVHAVDADIGNWTVRPDGLAICFPLYSIGGYPESSAIVTIPWGKLRPYIAAGASDLLPKG